MFGNYVALLILIIFGGYNTVDYINTASILKKENNLTLNGSYRKMFIHTSIINSKLGCV